MNIVYSVCDTVLVWMKLIKEFLQLDSATFQMVKWFDDTAYGLPLQGFDNSTIGDSFINANNVNKVCIPLLVGKKRFSIGGSKV